MDLKRIGLYIQSAFYVFAGVNHFVNPQFYFPLIPDYLVELDAFINAFAGTAEVAFGIQLLFQKTRKRAATALVILLIAFIPSHVYFIQIGSCVEGGLCVPSWVGWLRLVVIHPLVLYWAWIYRKD
jgi:uncharacterized membrane protein